MNAQPTAPNGNTLTQALAEMEREHGVRLRVYPKWVESGTLGRYQASEQMDRLEAAMHFLKSLMPHE